MPTASAHLCARCGKIVRGKCECSKSWGSSTRRGSTRASRKLRAQVLAEQPICAWPGCDELATEDDHIVPVHQRPDLDLVRENHQGLCSTHHEQKTQLEAAAARR